MQPLCPPVEKLITCNFQICFPVPILAYMLIIATCRTCPEAELAPDLCNVAAKYVTNVSLVLKDSNTESQELKIRSLNHVYSLKTKSSRCETTLLIAIPAPVSGHQHGC